MASMASLSRTVVHLEKTMAHMNGIASSVNGKSEAIAEFIDNLESLSCKLGSVIASADTLICGANEAIVTLNESDIKGLVLSFRNLLDNINDPDGSIGKLLVDGSVYDSVEELLTDVDILVKKIQENPKKYLKISVF